MKSDVDKILIITVQEAAVNNKLKQTADPEMFYTGLQKKMMMNNRLHNGPRGCAQKRQLKKILEIK